MRPLRTCLAALVLIGLALAVPGEVRWAERDWDNELGDNNWFNPVNWNPDGSPDPSDDYSIDGPGNPTLNLTGGSATLSGNLRVAHTEDSAWAIPTDKTKPFPFRKGTQ